MTDQTAFDPGEFRSRSARFRDWSTTVAVLITVGLALRHGLLPGVELVRAEAEPFEWANRLLREFAAAGAAIFYACAIWALRSVFARLSEGVRFEPALGRGVGRVGEYLVWGAVTAVVITPNVLNQTDGTPGGFDLNPDANSLVIGVVGVGLMLLGGLFSRAAAQETELNEII